MRTNIEIDDTLMADVMKESGAKTKREAVEMGLRTLLEIRRQRGLRDLWGLGWDGDLDQMRRDA